MGIYTIIAIIDPKFALAIRLYLLVLQHEPSVKAGIQYASE